MDGTAAINHNIEALKRIRASLAAMAGFDLASPLWGSHPIPLDGQLKTTLPRHLRLAILRLLRPAEAAARRLIIASARGLVVTLPPPRKARAKPATAEAQLRRLGIAVVMSPADLACAASILPRSRARETAGGGGEGGLRVPALPLFDPPMRFLGGRPRRRYVPPHAAPRILSPGLATPHTLPPPPSPDDPVDAARLGLRLAALAAALDDVPGQARRFARWKARSKARDGASAGRIGRISPLRPGRPPGGRLRRFDPSAKRSSAIRDIDEILAHAHALALYALGPPDTS